MPKVTGLVSPRAQARASCQERLHSPFGFPASQGQQLNFWRVEKWSGPHTGLWAVNKELIKISDQNSSSLRTRWKLIRGSREGQTTSSKPNLSTGEGSQPCYKSVTPEHETEHYSGGKSQLGIQFFMSPSTNYCFLASSGHQSRSRAESLLCAGPCARCGYSCTRQGPPSRRVKSSRAGPRDMLKTH